MRQSFCSQSNEELRSCRSRDFRNVCHSQQPSCWSKGSSPVLIWKRLARSSLSTSSITSGEISSLQNIVFVDFVDLGPLIVKRDTWNFTLSSFSCQQELEVLTGNRTCLLKKLKRESARKLSVDADIYEGNELLWLEFLPYLGSCERWVCFFGCRVHQLFFYLR